jgi:hypothetical protein
MARVADHIRTWTFPLLLLGFAAALGTQPTAASAAEETVSAFSVWEGGGSIVKTGENHATFVGLFVGPVYVETERGPVAAGQMICPAVVEIDLASGKQEGKARCAFEATDGGTIYAVVTCSGVHLVGCDGVFTITGGTERFAGITGGGDGTIRGNFHEIDIRPGHPVEELARGIIYWPELRYTVP